MSDRKLWDQYVALENECDTLRAKIAEMEKQEPVAWMLNCQTLGGDTGWILSWTQSGAGLCNRLSGEENEKKLYTRPVAQPTRDLLLRSRVADLLHLLQFAQVACPTAGDSEQAEAVMADIRRMLEQEAKP